jgi:ATP-dependent RNA helicase DbpA
MRTGDMPGALPAKRDSGVNRSVKSRADQPSYVAVARNIANIAVKKLSAGKVKGKTGKVRALED